MGLKFTQLMYSLCFLFFFSLLDDGGSCWFRLVVASVGAGLWSDSLMLSLLWLELLRCDFVGFVGRLFLGWRWRKREKNESPREDSLLCRNRGSQSLSQEKLYPVFVLYYFSLTRDGPHKILLLTHKGWTPPFYITSHSQGMDHTRYYFSLTSGVHPL